jgi:hypothetical protein
MVIRNLPKNIQFRQAIGINPGVRQRPNREQAIPPVTIQMDWCPCGDARDNLGDLAQRHDFYFFAHACLSSIKFVRLQT